MKYYIVTNRQIITVDGKEQIDTTNDGACSENLRFATYDSGSNNPNAYTLIPDKSLLDTQQTVAGSAVPAPYYFNRAQLVKTGSERFFTELAGDMASDNGGDLLIFIHGFNVDWAGGIADLKTIEKCFVAPAKSQIKHLLLFSWPSRGSVLKYKTDAQDAITSGITLGRCFQLFTEFLNEAFSGTSPKLKPCGNKIHLLCHSMGNRLLQTMVDKLMADGNKYQDVFEEVILPAADVDNNIFENPLSFYYLNNLCRRIHVYCNRNDLILKFSAKYENPLRRLGSDGPANINVLPSHVYVIDCTDAAFKYDPNLESKITQHDYFDMVPEVSSVRTETPYFFKKFQFSNFSGRC